MPRAGITVLVATGLHRPNEGQELAELVGDPWVLETVTVANHDARADEDHVPLGRTPGRGTVVRLDRRLVEAELKIATGLVEPHFMAGWSGGRKVIAPGVAHAETITTFHNAAFMAHPRAANCVLDGNPLHEEQLAIVGMLGGALALNTVIDDRRRLAFVNFGEVVQSHLQAVDFAGAYARVPVGRRFQTVVTSAAGYPLDRTYYQTVKGMVGPLDILEPGGDLIVASACSDGMGSKHYVEAQRRLVDLGAGRVRVEHRGEAARRHRRVADPDAAQAHAGRPRAALHGRPGSARRGADRRGARDRSDRRHRGQHGAAPGSAGGLRARGALRGAGARGGLMFDAVIVGAGFAGLYMLHRLRGLGLTARVYEAGKGVGGTWYWNRYPGARCDVESMDYSYSFSDELQQEWRWTERYSAQPEILKYANHVADRFDLRKDIQFETRVTVGDVRRDDRPLDGRDGPGRPGDRRASASWPPAACRTRRCPTSRAARPSRASGTTPASGRTRAWTSPAGGSGSSGPGPPRSSPSRSSRSRPRISSSSSARRTTACPPRTRRSIPTYERRVKETYADFRRQARESRVGFVTERSGDSALAVPEEERMREYEKRWSRGGLGFSAAYTDLLISKEANDTAAEFFRAKIRDIVRDPEVARALTPTDYPLGTKRLCVDTGYYDTFNRDNVTLVDLRKTPIEAITPRGVRTSEAEYAVDALVFATGFDAMTGALLNIDIRGRGGRRIQEAWAAGPADLSRPLDRRLPEPLHDHRPGQPVRAQQHDRVHRAARGLDRGLPQPTSAGTATRASRRPPRRRRRGSSTSTRWGT